MPMAYTQCGSCGTVFGTQAPYNVVFLHVRRATLRLRTPTPQKSSKNFFFYRDLENINLLTVEIHACVSAMIACIALQAMAATPVFVAVPLARTYGCMHAIVGEVIN